MINFSNFIEHCENDLIEKRKLSDATMVLFQGLSESEKKRCKPVVDLVNGELVDVEITMPSNEEFTSMQRIAVCRLVPLWFALDTETPAWSSYILTKAIKCLSQINGITLSEIGVAFLEVLCQFSTNLNRYVYNFCIDISREFTIQHRRRLSEFEALVSWSDTQCSNLPSVAFLKYGLVPIDCYTPKFILQTIIPLIQNEYFDEFIIGIKYLFEDAEYKRDFLQHLQKSELPIHDKNLISNVVTEQKNRIY